MEDNKTDYAERDYAKELFKKSIIEKLLKMVNEERFDEALEIIKADRLLFRNEERLRFVRAIEEILRNQDSEREISTKAY